VNENFKRLHGNKATGSTGEWRVEKQRLRWDMLDAFAQAAQQAGIPATDDFNRGTNEGVGYFEVNQKSGWRWNTAKAFLRPTCYGRPNFEMWTSAQATPAHRNQPDGSRAAPACRCGRPEMVTARRARGAAERGRRQLAAAAAAVGHRARRAAASTALTWCTICPAWAPTCRTICRSARSTRCRACPRSTPWPARWWARPRSGWNTRSSAAAP
jgi:hypothetical protein